MTANKPKVRLKRGDRVLVRDNYTGQQHPGILDYRTSTEWYIKECKFLRAPREDIELAPAEEKGNKHEGEVEVCAHRVAYRYWGFEAELTDELKARLEDEAEQRAKFCIGDGFKSGELNYGHVGEDQKDEEIRGWWEIVTN